MWRCWSQLQVSGVVLQKIRVTCLIPNCVAEGTPPGDSIASFCVCTSEQVGFRESSHGYIRIGNRSKFVQEMHVNTDFPKLFGGTTQPFQICSLVDQSLKEKNRVGWTSARNVAVLFRQNHRSCFCFASYAVPYAVLKVLKRAYLLARNVLLQLEKHVHAMTRSRSQLLLIFSL